MLKIFASRKGMCVCVRRPSLTDNKYTHTLLYNSHLQRSSQDVKKKHTKRFFQQEKLKCLYYIFFVDFDETNNGLIIIMVILWY